MAQIRFTSRLHLDKTLTYFVLRFAAPPLHFSHFVYKYFNLKNSKDFQPLIWWFKNQSWPHISWIATLFFLNLYLARPLEFSPILSYLNSTKWITNRLFWLPLDPSIFSTCSPTSSLPCLLFLSKFNYQVSFFSTLLFLLVWQRKWSNRCMPPQ